MGWAVGARTACAAGHEEGAARGSLAAGGAPWRAALWHWQTCWCVSLVEGAAAWGGGAGAAGGRARRATPASSRVPPGPHQITPRGAAWV